MKTDLNIYYCWIENKKVHVDSDKPLKYDLFKYKRCVTAPSKNIAEMIFNANLTTMKRD